MSEIKETDLRMGNLVHFGVNIVPIKSIHTESVLKNSVHVYVELNEKLSNLCLDMSEISSIPLTRDILVENCGFEEVKYETDDFHDIEYHLKVNEDIFISYSDDFSCGVWSNKSRMEEFGVIPKWENVKYLHGLQNLVHILSGQELEFKQTK